MVPGIVVTVLMGLAIWFSWWYFRGRTRTMREAITVGTVEAISGMCAAHMKTTGIGRTRHTSYWLEVRGQRITITNRQHQRLKTAPGDYIVYFDPAINEALGMEPADG